ncbi:MAG: hypothetical protein ACRYGL_02985, partial [Janthinobacterium lividum]
SVRRRFSLLRASDGSTSAMLSGNNQIDIVDILSIQCGGRQRREPKQKRSGIDETGRTPGRR